MLIQNTLVKTEYPIFIQEKCFLGNIFEFTVMKISENINLWKW